MPRFHRQYIQDLPLGRRGVLKALGGGAALSALAPVSPAFARKPERIPVSDGALRNKIIGESALDLWGMAMSFGEDRLDLIDLDGSQIVHSFEGLDASHAITPIEHLNRFIIHGFKPEKRVGSLLVVQVDPVTKAWEVLLDQDLPGGRLLHWQPRPDMSEIVFNSIGDGGLHVLDTKTLKISSYIGGGVHSNMAMMDDLLIATDQMSGPSQLFVTDRKTNKILSETPLSPWGHGVTVNYERGEAFVWARDGVHRISLAAKTMGEHLGVILPPNIGERCWFCWTPQGSRYAHDVAWGWDNDEGDVYQDYLSVIDMKQGKLEQIPTGNSDIRPSFLQVSPDGKWGLASIRGHDDIAIFDLVENSFKGTVSAGPAKVSFFERDMAFSKDRNFAMVTNSGENSISMIDLKAREEVRRIYLPRRPLWFKALSV